MDAAVCNRLQIFCSALPSNLVAALFALDGIEIFVSQ